MIAPYRESGIVLDIGTGDGRFVSSVAKANPEKFYIGIDANAKPLEKPSMKATRRPAKGGLPNAMFVQAAAEDLPEEFAGIASEIHVNFPWGSLLRAVATGDPAILDSLGRILIPNGSLTITIGIDPSRDRTELDRLDIPEISLNYLESALSGHYLHTRFRVIVIGELTSDEWEKIDTSWARKLGGNRERRVFRMRFAKVA